MSGQYRDIAQLSGPIIVAQLGTIATGYADTMMVGHYATAALGAASFVNNATMLAILLSLGFSYGITPLVGALHARGDAMSVGAMLRQVTVANALFGAALMALMAIFYFLIDDLGQPAELLPLIKSYYRIIWVSMIPVIFTHVWRQFCDALGHTSLGMWIFSMGNVLNIVGNYALIYGHWGAPELGLDGAGWSTLAGRLLMCVAYLVVLSSAPRYRPMWRAFKTSTCSRRAISSVFKSSLPVAVQMGLETAIFTFALILVGWFGTNALAAYQVLLMLGNLGFMIYYAFGAGTAIRIAHFHGLGDKASIRTCARAGYTLTLLFTGMSCAIFYFFGRYIISFFTSDPAVIAIALSLIPPLLVYQLGDATQVTFANALRGMNCTVAMMRGAVVAYVLLGFPAIYLLAITIGYGIVGIYYGFFIALLAAAFLFLRDFYRSTRR